MALKQEVHERCPRCGAIQSRLLPDGSVALAHHCPKGPPGPPNPPRKYRPGEVVFVPQVEVRL